MSVPDLTQPIIGYRVFKTEYFLPYVIAMKHNKFNISEQGWLEAMQEAEGQVLCSVVSPYQWKPGVNTAHCSYDRCGNPPSPYAGACGECGLYACHKAYDIGYRGIVGAILAWGKIEVHYTGFRAEHAKIIGIIGHTTLGSGYLPSDGYRPLSELVKNGIRKSYNIPVFDKSVKPLQNLIELKEYAETLGSAVPQQYIEEVKERWEAGEDQFFSQMPQHTLNMIKRVLGGHNENS